MQASKAIKEHLTQRRRDPAEFRGNPSSDRRSATVATEARGEVTRLLEEVASGNKEAKNELFAQVYEEPRQMAHRRMAHERAGYTLGATELVHEVYFRLMKGQHVFTKNRAYFFGAAAKAMNRLLREHARTRIRRPGGHILLDEVAEAVESSFKVDLLDLMNALDKLKTTGKHGERRYDVVRLRIWGGLTYQEIADDLGVGVATVERDWQAARAWLYGRLKGRRLYGRLKGGRTDD
jgi:RNA polymerase sigma factor (TIGR02999 family)